MDSPESCHDVAALQPGLETGAGEHSHVNGGLISFDTPAPNAMSATSNEEESSSAASLLSLSGTIEPHLQRVLDWVESPTFPTPDWIEFPLAPPQFEELKKLDQLEYLCLEEFRYDYSEADEILTFRMAGAGHECIKCNLTVKISQGLADAATRDDNSQSAREFALLPTSGYGSMFVMYRSSNMAGKKTVHSPDAQFVADADRLPSLVIEVAWTQSPKKLQKLAYDYILGSNARIRTVIGFDVDRPGRKGAIVCVWRPVYNEDNIAVSCDSTEIRSASGVKNPDPEAGLRLTLDDFAYSRNPEEYPDLDSVGIFIPVDDLHKILERAEALQECVRLRNERLLAEEPTSPKAKQTASHGYSLGSRGRR